RLFGCGLHGWRAAGPAWLRNLHLLRARLGRMLRLAQANTELETGDSEQRADRCAAQDQTRGARLLRRWSAIAMAQVGDRRQLHAWALPQRFGQRLAERARVFEACARDLRQAAREHGVHVR